MKYLLSALGLLVLLAAAFVSYGVWRAMAEPVYATPDAYEVGRAQLHSQLETAKKREAEFERQDWNSIIQLQGLIASHKHRMEKLAGNTQAAEILAYDHDSVTRLEARIADLEAKQRAEYLQRLEDDRQAEADSKAQTKAETKLAAKPR